MRKTRILKALVVAAAMAIVSVLAVTGAPVANADTLSNGLTVSCTQDSDIHATCVVGGCPRVNGDYVVDAVHAKINGGAQSEDDFKCINGQTARYGVDNNRAPVNIGVQACRKKDLEGDWCTPYANYTFTPPEAPKPAAQDVTCPAGSTSPTVPAGQQCTAAPKPDIVCPADSPTKTVPAGGTCAAAPVAPTDAVTLNFDKGGLQWTANVASSADIAGKCTYAATNPLLPGVNKSFNLGAKGTASFSVLAPPPLSTYHVVVSCSGPFNGKTVEYGHVEQDVP